jgi:hypothetical protein
MPHVRLGSKVDIRAAKTHVRFAPISDVNCVFWHVRFGPKADVCTAKNSWLEAALVHAGALLTNHIAPGRRTLAPLAYGASASRSEATTAETTSAGWLRSQLFTAPIWVD